MDVCSPVLKESNNSWFDSYSVRNSVLSISHITFLDCHGTFFPTTFLEIAEEVHFYDQKELGVGVRVKLSLYRNLTDSNCHF